MKSIFFSLLIVGFSAVAMDDKKPFYPDPEISFSDLDVPYPDSSTADNRDKKVITIDEEDLKRINALIDALNKSKPVRVALSQLQRIPETGSHFITSPLIKETTAPINVVLAQTCGVSTSDRPIITQARLKLDESELQLVDSNETVALKSSIGVISGREQNPIQMGAPINPGNFGGSLVNNRGEVVGINTAGIAAAQSVDYRIPEADEEGALEPSSLYFLNRHLLQQSEYHTPCVVFIDDIEMKRSLREQREEMARLKYIARLRKIAKDIGRDDLSDEEILARESLKASIINTRK